MEKGNVEKLNGSINRNTYISLAMVVTLIGGVITFTMFFTNVRADVNTNTGDIGQLQENIVPRKELEVTLKSMDESIKRIESAVVK